MTLKVRVLSPRTLQAGSIPPPPSRTGKSQGRGSEDLHLGALIITLKIRIGVPLKGSLNRALQGLYDIGA